MWLPINFFRPKLNKEGKRQDDTLVKNPLRLVNLLAIVLLVIIAFGLFIGFGSITNVQSTIADIALKFGSASAEVKVLHNILISIFVQLTLNVVLLILIIIILVFLKKALRELTSTSVGKLKTMTLITLISSAVIIIYEIVVLVLIDKQYAALEIVEEDNVVFYILNIVCLAGLFFFFIRANRAFTALKKIEEPFEEDISND